MRSAILAPAVTRTIPVMAVGVRSARHDWCQHGHYHGYNRRPMWFKPAISPFVPSAILKLNRSEFLTHNALVR